MPDQRYIYELNNRSCLPAYYLEWLWFKLYTYAKIQ